MSSSSFLTKAGNVANELAPMVTWRKNFLRSDFIYKRLVTANIHNLIFNPSILIKIKQSVDLVQRKVI